ncbi:alpha/beta fold hydrolase [Natronomonas salina]|uniref:alpha/beta fold hydrolase n=1 Tax=Natronomonas salina TaxID=1710540 RepID=UPI0015B5CBC1|nr:alpha/beta hydrolase [Natronomonas salina]QLD89755.1 alpha/beta fold hydrolase [Natronomonas salina]
MPTVTTEGTTLAYEVAGEPDRPTVVFVADAGFGPWIWGWQAPQLSGPYRTVVYATRGTDGSDAAGPYDVDRLAADLEAVLADADVPRVHVVGAGLGGMVALRYAREYARARSLTLVGTAPSGQEIDDEALSALHPEDPTRLRESLSLAFTDGFLAETGLVDDVVEWRREEDAVGDALAGHREAVRSFEAGPRYEIALPTLVLHGLEDPVVDVEAGRELAADLPRGRFEAVEGKRCCYVEHSAAVSDAIDRFVDGVSADYSG